jgi:putative flippase GtrA
MPSQAIAFSVVSGLGWTVDVCLTALLVSIGLSPFSSSCIGAGTAVTFVYVVSRWMVFRGSGAGHPHEFILYITWQLCAIVAASILVASLVVLLNASSTRYAAFLANTYGWPALDGLALATVASKILVTPLTLAANFVFMRWLTQRGYKGIRSDRLEGQ